PLHHLCEEEPYLLILLLNASRRDLKPRMFPTPRLSTYGELCHTFKTKPIKVARRS
ncbi:unnamed protein product, partial [Dovyalis caffra]